MRPLGQHADMDNASTSEMVTDAIRTLRERGGSSLQNIKKYIEAIYQVDMQRRAPYIRKYIRNAVIQGDLTQTRGRGAAGSFKLATASKPPTYVAKTAPRAPRASPKASPKAAAQAPPKAAAKAPAQAAPKVVTQAAPPKAGKAETPAQPDSTAVKRPNKPPKNRSATRKKNQPKKTASNRKKGRSKRK